MADTIFDSSTHDDDDYDVDQVKTDDTTGIDDGETTYAGDNGDDADVADLDDSLDDDTDDEDGEESYLYDDDYDEDEDGDEDDDEDDEAYGDDTIELDFDAPEENFDDVDDEGDTDLYGEESNDDDDLDGDLDDATTEQLMRENEVYRQRIEKLEDSALEVAEEVVTAFLDDVATKFGIDTGDDLDVETLTETLMSELNARSKRADEARRNLAVFQAAVPLNADMDKLMDSKKFTETIEAIDPTAPNYDQQIAYAVATAIDHNPTFKAPASIDRMGADFSGGTNPAPTGPLSIEELAARRRKRRGIN